LQLRKNRPLQEGVIELKINESNIDRVIRGVVGVILLVVGVVLVKGTLDIVLDVIGVILLVTGIVGFCPIYALLHIGTSKKS
jgi:hypothetical protein